MMRTFGLEVVSARTFFAFGALTGFSLFAGRSALAFLSVLAGLSARAAAPRVPLAVRGFLSSCCLPSSKPSAPSSFFGALASVFLGLLGPLPRLFLTGRSCRSEPFSSCTASDFPSSFPFAFCAGSSDFFVSAACPASCFVSCTGALFTFCAAASFFLETNSASSARTDFSSCCGAWE